MQLFSYSLCILMFAMKYGVIRIHLPNPTEHFMKSCHSAEQSFRTTALKMRAYTTVSLLLNTVMTY